MLPGGGVILDTPGMRELQLWDADLEQTFGDVEEIAAQLPLLRLRPRAASPAAPCARRSPTARCRAERWESYVKLQRELEAIEVRRNHLLRQEQRAGVQDSRTRRTDPKKKR